MKAERKQVKRKCPVCNGLKYVEYEAGLIRTDCPRCAGSGSILIMRKVKKNEVAAGAG